MLKELQEEVPAGLIPLLQLPGLGGKKIAKLYKELGVEDAEDLEQACRDGRVQALAGFGKKTEKQSRTWILSLLPMILHQRKKPC
ncbi:DNA polymerase/3'-5' exonuclease PolX [Mycobacteroides abscessus subsp. abscessus]|nr:DNA polymerase/3'-5' exonuclease PolX [Mycobacteroides abscessus subsp. abscessus]